MHNPHLLSACYVLLERKNCIFMLKRANTGYYDGFWGLPAGHVEFEEMPLAAAIREAKEETGVIINPQDLSFKCVMHRIQKGERSYADYLFHTSAWQNEPKNTEPNKASDCDWFDLNNLPENIVPGIKPFFAALQNQQQFIEQWETIT